MEKIYKAITFTTFHSTESCNYGYMYIEVNGKLVYNGKIPYQQAVKQAYQLKRELNKPFKMANNRFEPTITTVEIGGFLN